MNWKLVLATLVLGVSLFSCSHKDQATTESGPRATVVLRDGTRVGGTVTENSSTKITIAGDDGIARTIPLTQVSAIQYGDAAAPETAQTAQTAAVPPPQSSPAQPAPQSQAAHKAVTHQVPPLPPPIAPSETRVQPGGDIEVHTHPTESAVTTKTYEVPVGTKVSIRTEETIDSAKAVEGQTFEGEVTEDVLDADGATVIPRGANAKLIIKSASKGGRFRGASDLVVDLKEVAVDGREYQVSSSDVAQQGKAGVGANKRTAIYTGGGAALGAIIGAIAGGGKGAAIGAGAGAGGGALTQVLTKGSAIRIPVETVLSFQLDQPLRVVAAQ
jgi:hypothetical protein